MTFTQLRTFALVAELGSLRAAATALGVSEPAVSAAVAALRTDLGDPLFRRTGTGIELTAGGRALAVRADLRGGRLVRLPVEGTPVPGMWWAGVPGGERATPAATALQRFLTTPDATSALLAGPTPRDRARPTVRVELWSGQPSDG